MGYTFEAGPNIIISRAEPEGDKVLRWEYYSLPAT